MEVDDGYKVTSGGARTCPATYKQAQLLDLVAIELRLFNVNTEQVYYQILTNSN